MLEKPWFAAANYEKGGILPFRTHRQVLAQANGWVAWVDEKLLDDIGRLWTAGMETYNSCQDNEGRWLSLPEVHVTRARDMLPWVSVTQKAFRGILLLERQRREKRA
jgi:hypothetical protein